MNKLNNKFFLLLILFAHSGVQHILCCALLCLSSSCVPYVASFSGLSILIASSIFFNVYFKYTSYFIFTEEIILNRWFNKPIAWHLCDKYSLRKYTKCICVHATASVWHYVSFWLQEIQKHTQLLHLIIDNWIHFNKTKISHHTVNTIHRKVVIIVSSSSSSKLVVTITSNNLINSHYIVYFRGSFGVCQ